MTSEQLRYVDCFFGVRSVLFMPVAGPCFYALSHDHTHPGYMFVAPFDDLGRIAIGDKEITALPDRVVVVSPDIVHHELPSETTPRYIALLIELRLFETEMRRYRRTIPMFRAEQFPRPDDLLPLVRRYMRESQSNSLGRDAVLAALEVELCHSLIRGIVGEPPASEPVLERLRVGRAIEEIHTRLSEKLSVESLAVVAGLSTTHFRRIFTAETGSSPAEYLRQVRLERAKKLILAGDMTLTDIALECGLGSSAYLSATFSRVFGVSPAAYRTLVSEGRISQKNGRKTKA